MQIPGKLRCRTKKQGSDVHYLDKEIWMNENSLILSKDELNTKRKITHTPSVIQADTLFTFMTELRYLLSILENRMISPRYNDETINYLRIPKIKKIAFPMKCFCDIPLSKIFA